MQEEERYWSEVQSLLVASRLRTTNTYHPLPPPSSLDSPLSQLMPLLVLVTYLVAWTRPPFLRDLNHWSQNPSQFLLLSNWTTPLPVITY